MSSTRLKAAFDASDDRYINVYGDTATGSITLNGDPYATESWVSGQISSLVGGAPAALDTLNELAAALGDNASFATSVTNSIATKLDASVNPIKNATVSNDTITFTRADNTTFAVSTSDANTNYYLNGVTRSGNVLTFSVNGTTNQTYTFGSNAFTSYSDHSTQGYLTSLPSHNHNSLYDPIGASATVNTRIDTEILPAIGAKLDSSVNPIKGATVSNDTITFTRSDNTTFSVTTSDADTNTWRGIDDVPVNGQTSESISSNWAYDHANGSNPHNITPALIGAQPAGSYLTSIPAEYLTEGEGDARYQPVGNYQAAGSYLTPSDKAADSNLLDGLDLHTGRNNVANRVVSTNGSGEADFGRINTTSSNTTSTLPNIDVTTNTVYS